MAIWYYYGNNGEKVGPMRGRQLKQLAQQRTITPETIIEDESGRTTLAKNAMGLTFPETTQPDKEETYDMVTPPQRTRPSVANPFTAAPPVSDNPFIGTTQVSGNSFVAAPTVNQAVPQIIPVDVAKESKASLWVAIVGIVVLLAVGGTIVYKVLKANQNSKPSFNDNPQEEKNQI